MIRLFELFSAYFGIIVNYFYGKRKVFGNKDAA